MMFIRAAGLVAHRWVLVLFSQPPRLNKGCTKECRWSKAVLQHRIVYRLP
jgi:hypothetical protein